jgi:hypothetical protein
MKILEISRCNSCPFVNRFGECGKMQERPIDIDTWVIPDWCPLPDWQVFPTAYNCPKNCRINGEACPVGYRIPPTLARDESLPLCPYFKESK